MALACVLVAISPSVVITPEAYGAKGDGVADDSEPIRQAVSFCAGDAPCSVLFAQSYLSGPIRINSSGVTLNVTGSLSMLPRARFPLAAAHGGFITNDNLVATSELRITGGGRIASTKPDAWWTCKILGCSRPHLINLGNVSGVRIDDIALADSPNHHIEVSGCRHVRIDGITIDAPHLSPNTDGVTFYGGDDQSLTNSRISNGDDCTSVVPVGEWLPECVGSPELPQCRGGSVVIRNVTCIGGHGLAIGGMRHGTVSNVTFSNITATGARGDTQGKYSTGGMRIKAYPNSTGSVKNVVYEDIVVDGVYLPLQLLGHYCPFPCKTADGNTSVLFEDITFRRISGAGRRAEQIVFDCSPLAPCTNITVEDVQLKANGTATCHHANVLFRRSSPSQCEPSEPHSV